MLRLKLQFTASLFFCLFFATGLLPLALISCGDDGEVMLAPEITSFDPTSGSPGSSVTVYGANFGDDPDVYFNGMDATVTSGSDTELTVIVPSGAIDGAIIVSTDGGSVKSEESFTVL